jgi:hypothetical protein
VVGEVVKRKLRWTRQHSLPRGIRSVKTRLMRNRLVTLNTIERRCNNDQDWYRRRVMIWKWSELSQEGYGTIQ